MNCKECGTNDLTNGFQAGIEQFYCATCFFKGKPYLICHVTFDIKKIMMDKMENYLNNSLKCYDTPQIDNVELDDIAFDDGQHATFVFKVDKSKIDNSRDFLVKELCHLVNNQFKELDPKYLFLNIY